jgi:hypothetical protein
MENQMFEPGQKIIVTQSNVKRKTGPRCGSVGFVSDFETNVTGIRFNRIIWYRYGRQQKKRLETSSFAMMFGKLADFQKQDWRLRLHCRNYGTLMPIPDTRKIEDLDELEFKCWVYSIIRIGQRLPKYDTSRIHNGFFINPKPAYILSQNFEPKHRLEIAKRARRIRELYIKANTAQLQKAVRSARTRLRQKLARGYSIEDMLVLNMRKRNQYTAFYNKLFTRLEYESISGPKVIQELEGEPITLQCLKRMRQEWRSMNGYSN